MKQLLWLLFFNIALIADSVRSFHDIEKSALSGDGYAQYQLATMYENGSGTDQNMTQAFYWYKKAAYNALAKSEDNTSIGSDKQVYQIDPVTDKKMQKFGNEHLDMPKNSEERKSLVSTMFSNFGILPHEKNYLIPFSYTTENYEKRNSIDYPGYNVFNSNVETEFQISFKKTLSYDLLGWNETLSFGYTQEVWWQLYTNSAPFRETNYKPEFWITIPSTHELDSLSGLKDISIGFLHKSNGLGKPLSRDMNQVYSDLDFQYNDLLIQLRGCYTHASSDNKDITSYLGYGHLKFKYLYGQHQFELTLRDNLYFNSNNRGSIEGEYSYPINNSKNNFLFIKGFSGYGESLMDYNHPQNRLGIGLLISR
ncbi:phospholipase A [Sulfuricurvum sp.]|uniref:phospholipase A n=1 Tax=Sulfuricurvum sp. TaxID=2025608 RepID=UPI0026340941|nr:phospholipase A [Sulfuricurvum sp.]MDD2266150.1 phospholipase A [Sulfuricurvum sp.]MDD2784061.1 phospholipase A [Sulfuricurvum sp.]